LLYLFYIKTVITFVKHLPLTMNNIKLKGE
jgi:hypothetical protein